ncbi:unnamed protein product, partial [Staurois parvus]
TLSLLCSPPQKDLSLVQFYDRLCIDYPDQAFHMLNVHRNYCYRLGNYHGP